MVDETTKAWLGAILDLKAHILYKDNKQRAGDSTQITLYVNSTIPQVAKRLCELTGVSPQFKSHKRLKEEWLRKGCAEHCPEEHVHQRSAEFPEAVNWTVTGSSLAVILWNVHKYMVTDREPWEWALSQCLGQLKLAGRGSFSVRAAVTRLAALGWDIPPLLADLEPLPLEAVGEEPEAACGT